MKRKLQSLAIALACIGQAQAHPLDFLSVEQRVYMMNVFLSAQDNLPANGGKAGAADGSGAKPLTMEQRVKLMEWFMTGQTSGGTQAQASAAPAPVAPAAAGLPAEMLQAKSMPSMPAPTAPVVANAINSEADLEAIFARWKPLPTGVKFERFRDGFSIDGTRYVDPEGTIVSYGFDAQSGDFTYLVQSNVGQYVLKAGRASSPDEPIEIAHAERRGPQWAVTTKTGKKLAGSRLIPLARGFIVARDNTGFRYVPGKGTTPITAPEKFNIAALQGGSVSSTGYILLERLPENDPSGGLFGTIQSLGATLGVSKKEDYALLNIDTRKLVPINISMEDKRVQVLSACHKRNAFINDCDRMDSFDSLFQPNGGKNMTHYFWRINWFNAGGRPIMVSQEGGLSKVTATDLNTGKKVILFERTLGIASFSAEQGTNGKISVSAQMGFSSEKKDDVATLLDTLPDMTAAASGAGTGS